MSELRKLGNFTGAEELANKIKPVLEKHENRRHSKESQRAIVA